MSKKVFLSSLFIALLLVTNIFICFNKNIISPLISKEENEIFNQEIDFSQVELEAVFIETATVKIPINDIKISKEGNYRIRINGYWDMYMGNELWVQFPWWGDNSTAEPLEYRYEKRVNFGSVLLYDNSKNITPTTEEGSLFFLDKNSNLFIRLNILIKPEEFYSLEINKNVFRNSLNKPLKIIIEKEVEE